MIRNGQAGLYDWLANNPEAYDVLDDAVLGCLLDSTVDDICADFRVPRADFRHALNEALRNGC